MKALLFINGEPPEKLPSFLGYTCVACTDGAFRYLKNQGFPLQKLKYISGDFDSLSDEELLGFEEKKIFTPDQNKTDFEKTLEILLRKNINAVDVYGGSGKEMDHFLGNLTVAHRYTKFLSLKFYDRYSEYFFVPKNFILGGVKDLIISLYPFPLAKEVTTRGLHWNLNKEDLTVNTKVSIRNYATSDEIEITYTEGSLLFFKEKTGKIRKSII
ncbi:MAG: thiamine diphosphokinase [Bergeyella sp.]|nr:thiamine diphosphokinase [Bergeyella sp.]